MHQNEKIDIVSLYSSGLGIRLISQKVGISKQAVKMKLIKKGCYRGASRKTDYSQKQVVPVPELEVGEKVALRWTLDGAAKVTNCPGGHKQVVLPGFSSLYSRIPASAWEKKVKVTFELDSFKSDLTIILGDESGESKELIHINEKQFFTLSKHIGKKAYCRLDNRGYDKQTVFLFDSFCEIAENQSTQG